jgi:hypothetical protein
MLKLGLSWMGVPVRMPGCRCQFYSPFSGVEVVWRVLRRKGLTILDQLPNKHGNLHRRQDIHDPRNPPIQPALLLLRLPFALFPPHAAFRVCIIPRRTTIIQLMSMPMPIHLRLRMQRYRVVIRKRVLLSAVIRRIRRAMRRVSAECAGRVGRVVVVEERRGVRVLCRRWGDGTVAFGVVCGGAMWLLLAVVVVVRRHACGRYEERWSGGRRWGRMPKDGG